MGLDGYADDDLLTPTEVSRIFKVNPKTVTRWARSGKLPCIRTLGGHRRFRVGDLRLAMAAAAEQEAS